MRNGRWLIVWTAALAAGLGGCATARSGPDLSKVSPSDSELPKFPPTTQPGMVGITGGERVAEGPTLKLLPDFKPVEMTPAERAIVNAGKPRDPNFLEFYQPPPPPRGAVGLTTASTMSSAGSGMAGVMATGKGPPAVAAGIGATSNAAGVSVASRTVGISPASVVHAGITETARPVGIGAVSKTAGRAQR